ncbi:hypothetical protein Pyrde_0212 [Pyrodictium delaneyi]|uniref:Uncharacterized protein n=2 Tax=Pyrodictium delaneyi TaxID=1273541 RepID=A0A0P0N1L1_9CREN|nr:hypothetical protein Pyrde_0212 [Pyrodictium delaneyi]
MMATKCCRGDYPPEACRLIEALLKGYSKYFSNDVLNSDGRRLLERLVRLLLETNPGLRRLVYRVRRNPTLEMILRLAEEFYLCDARALAAEALGLYQPYTYSVKSIYGRTQNDGWLLG